MKTAVVAVLLLGAFVFAAAPQDITIDYLEGRAQLSIGGGWRELSIGDRLPPEATIRLSEHGFLELAQGALRVSISRDGVYKLSELIGQSRQVAGWDLKNTVSGKLKSAAAGPRTGGDAAMGVRGDAAAAGEIQWMLGDETEELLARGRELVHSGRCAEALHAFQEGYENAAAEDRQVFLYYIALTHSEQGGTGRALAALRGFEPDPRGEMFAELVLLRGRLLVESLAFREALELCDRHLARQSAGGLAQALMILSAYCHRGLGNPGKARETLIRARDLDHGSELGREAVRLLQSL